PTPSSNIPFRHDPDFIERGNLLQQIQDRLSPHTARVALAGLGGVGKSMLAIEHCIQLRESEPGTWVPWVHASSSTRFHQSLREISEQIKLPKREDAQPGEVPRLLRAWLSNGENGPWLVVLDNVDDAGFLLEIHNENNSSLKLFDCFPASTHGRLLITTRSRSTARELVYEKEILTIEPMLKQHAIELLERKLGCLATQESIPDPASTLEYTPPALSQAATFITHRRPLFLVERYLKKFRKSEKSRSSILRYNGENLSQDDEAKNSIIITWQISFKHIRRTRRSAAELLSLLCFFDRSGIPINLLRTHFERECNKWQGTRDLSHPDVILDDDDNLSDRSADEAFELDLELLQDYSMVKIAEAGDVLEMHRLAQLGIRIWLKSHGQLERFACLFCIVLGAAHPEAEYEHWDQCRLLYPHVKYALELALPNGEETRRWASLLIKAASYAFEQGSASDAAWLSLASLQARRKEYGEEASETCYPMLLLAGANEQLASWKVAEKLRTQVVEATKGMFGEEHPQTLDSMAHLALTFHSQKRWKEEERLRMQILETRRRVLGEEHPDTPRSMSNLAWMYYIRPRWNEAEELGAQVLRARKRVLGEEHPDTLRSISNLTSRYNTRER
ncbi:hypothetical protein K431DRAFT_226002, partial [Polychaeton citri CBS 116435]